MPKALDLVLDLAVTAVLIYFVLIPAWKNLPRMRAAAKEGKPGDLILAAVVTFLIGIQVADAWFDFIHPAWLLLTMLVWIVLMIHMNRLRGQIQVASKIADALGKRYDEHLRGVKENEGATHEEMAAGYLRFHESFVKDVLAIEPEEPFEAILKKLGIGRACANCGTPRCREKVCDGQDHKEPSCHGH